MFDEQVASNEVQVTVDAAPFACPRCGVETAAASFYGPCPACREQLVQRWPGAARDVAADDYEPKMNVTPNFVATKD